jgi:hypothetical protein
MAVVLATGCGAPPLQGVGRPTDIPRLAGPDPNAAETGQTASPVSADFATRLARVGPDSFVSSGHAGGRYAATVYVTPAAKDVVLRVGTVVAPGTEIVMTNVDRASHTPGPTLFMQKEPSGAWRFGTRETTDAKHEGLALCARCHAEATGDHIFGLPE